MIRAAVAVVAALALIGAGTEAASAAPRDERALCIPLLMDCGDGGGVVDGVDRKSVV